MIFLAANKLPKKLTLQLSRKSKKLSFPANDRYTDRYKQYARKNQAQIQIR
jgi:hypothetical protein